MFGIPKFNAMWQPHGNASFWFGELLYRKDGDPKSKYHVVIFTPDGYVDEVNV